MSNSTFGLTRMGGFVDTYVNEGIYVTTSLPKQFRLTDTVVFPGTIGNHLSLAQTTFEFTFLYKEKNT
ncbi:hypothetical protein EHQ26_12330 [Leptospira bourretii]|uniref:Uncharacterized protein n=1 Tax=Leptospira bourretii TaxID=2484962 RepID=A0ABY2LEJ9_9LEPT|nr:hypothetical protein [Leptospira bourretii]TGK90903.1 hypothetical protein EHQ26_12330 [Leptospira bourretii]TGL23358.1 hypothetical protein EHQ47_05635 [Leptospira bourretii]TGL40282.1 hypothetical protein EHQ45_03425 [Leptospira bourretii]